MATTPTYAGYVARKPPVDWSKVASDIVTKMGDVEEQHAAFREKYDALATEAWDKLGEYEAGKSQTLNNFVYDATAEGRSVMTQMYNKMKRREISPDQFNRMKMSMTSEWEDFGKITKNYNDAIAAAIDGIASGDLGAGSEAALDKLGGLSNLKDKAPIWKPSENGFTNLYIGEIDANDNLVGDPLSMRTLGNVNNLIFKKVPLTTKVKEFTTGLGTTKLGRTTDPRLNKSYEEYKQAFINSTLTNDKATLSVLADWGGYTIYWPGDEVPAKGVKMITDENGQWMPELTDALNQEARDIVNNAVEGSIGKTVTAAPVDHESKTKQKALETAKYNAKKAQGALIGNEEAITEVMEIYNSTSNGKKNPIVNIAVDTQKKETIIQYKDGNETKIVNTDLTQGGKEIYLLLNPRGGAAYDEAVTKFDIEAGEMTAQGYDVIIPPAELARMERVSYAVNSIDAYKTWFLELQDIFGKDNVKFGKKGNFVLTNSAKKDKNFLLLWNTDKKLELSVLNKNSFAAMKEHMKGSSGGGELD